MNKKRDLFDEFQEAMSPPINTEEILKEFFDEFANFINPQNYGGDGILKSIVKLFIELVK